jgi:hypothetical protein
MGRERNQRKTYACELYREMGSGRVAPSMAKSVEWNEKWARLDKGIRHPTKLEVNQHGSTLRPLHSLTAASPGTSADFDGSRSSPSLGSTDPLELAGSTGRDSVGCAHVCRPHFSWSSPWNASFLRPLPDDIELLSLISCVLNLYQDIWIDIVRSLLERRSLAWE